VIVTSAVCQAYQDDPAGEVRLCGAVLRVDAMADEAEGLAGARSLWPHDYSVTVPV
jgi:hypothetical protein